MIIITAICFTFSGIMVKANQHLNVYNPDSIIHQYLNQVNTDSVEAYIQFLQDMETRFLIAPNRKDNAESIQQKFYDLGIEQVRIDSFQCATQIDYANLHFDTITWQYNVIASLPGISNSNIHWIVGAHYDDVVAPNGDPMILAPGADDNASGVAALFESARILCQNQFYPVHTIDFIAFAAEELMHYGNSGAQSFVDSLPSEATIELMINNDMIAHTSSNDWEIKLSNYVGAEWLTNIAEQLTYQYTDINPVVAAPSTEGSADCKYFVEAGIPSIYFMEKDFNPFYHSNNDLVENCDLNYCAEAIKITLGTLLQVNDSIITGNSSLTENHFSIYPNPTTGLLMVELNLNDGNREIKYFITNIHGQVVQTGFLNANVVNTIQINSLNRGLYFISTENTGELMRSKIILTKN
jgi:leucyl aminopeptidase